MLNTVLEDHTGGDLGYLNSLFNRLFCFGQEPTPDIRNNFYFRRFGLAGWMTVISPVSRVPPPPPSQTFQSQTLIKIATV